MDDGLLALPATATHRSNSLTHSTQKATTALHVPFGHQEFNQIGKFSSFSVPHFPLVLRNE